MEQKGLSARYNYDKPRTWIFQQNFIRVCHAHVRVTKHGSRRALGLKLRTLSSARRAVVREELVRLRLRLRLRRCDHPGHADSRQEEQKLCAGVGVPWDAIGVVKSALEDERGI